MTSQEFIDWVKSLKVPFTFTEEDREELLGNFSEAIIDVIVKTRPK